MNRLLLLALVVVVVLAGCARPRCISNANCPSTLPVCGEDGLCVGIESELPCLPKPQFETGSEDTLARCQDGADNDGNGYIDCNDFSCARSDDEPLAIYCQLSHEKTLEQCSDDNDNDGDGKTDCDDVSCAASTEESIALHCSGLHRICDE